MMRRWHMVVRLLGPDYGGRKEAIAQTVKADMLDSDQYDDQLALFGPRQPTSGAAVLMSSPSWWLLTSVSQI